MNAMNLFFSFKGRVSRKPFWLGLLAVMMVGYIPAIIASVMIFVAGDGTIPMGAIIIGPLSFLMFYPVAAIYVKRWHDHDCTGWKTLTIIQPIGGVWDLVEVWFRRGTAGPNRFGPDPLANVSSYYAQPVYTRTAAS